MKKLTPKDLKELSRPPRKFWSKAVFWNNVQKTLAIFGGPTTLTFHMFDAADIWVILSGLTSAAAAGIAIWFTDSDKDGVVDIFE